MKGRWFVLALSLSACGETPVAPSPLSPSVLVEPSSIDFEEREVGERRMRALTISNRGNDEVWVDTALLGDTRSFSLTQSGPFRLPAGDRVSFFAQYEPQREARHDSVLELRAMDHDWSQRVSLIGRGVPPASPEPWRVEVEPREIDFGEVALGHAPTDVLTFLNVSDESAVIPLPQMEGPFVPLSSARELVLGPGEAITFALGFIADASGEFEQSLALQTCPTCLREIRLHATVVEPRVVADIDSIDFGEVAVDSIASRSLELANATSVVSELSLSVESPFFVTDREGRPLPDTIVVPGHASTQLLVSVVAPEVGEWQSDLAVRPCDGCSPTKIPLRAVGLSPAAP